jgi:hypothetical protein
MKNRLEIDRVAFMGRTYREYAGIFDLDESALSAGPVLDCPAGPSSFAAEARGLGLDVTACDISYSLPLVGLIERCNNDISHVFERFDEASHLYVWEYYRTRKRWYPSGERRWSFLRRISPGDLKKAVTGRGSSPCFLSLTKSSGSSFPAISSFYTGTGWALISIWHLSRNSSGCPRGRSGFFPWRALIPGPVHFWVRLYPG